ncbi:SH3 and cysteine-rich domain-containing protein isoform X3 [Schistocerca americana]|uniref:SH3 and cysteine-rich domain-containing protein isoform X3 n=1 Tax=Schistocerca americana TaxID=7009 RepID=UPI001F500FA4|nr:SH3 and cysteine-rich domain-containing protein isoform X3 [Schistocerca americana]
MSNPTNAAMAAYLDCHNSYVQQLHATNGMLDQYHTETLPQLLQELEDVYSDLCTTLADSVLQGAEIISSRAEEQSRRYEGVSGQCRAVSARQDVASLVHSLASPQQHSQRHAHTHAFASPQPPPTPQPDNPDGTPNDGPPTPEQTPPPLLKNEIIVDRLASVSVRTRLDALRKEAMDLEQQMKQNQDALDTLLRIQQRSLESSLFNKANELQEDISLKRFDLRVAQIHLGAVKAQKELFASKAESASDGMRERKMSSSSTGSMKNKWLKAFKSLKASNTSDGALKEPEKKNQMYHAVSAIMTMRKEAAAGPDSGSHSLQEYTYRKITPCDVCSQVLRGHTRQGLKCKVCKVNVHADCQERLGRCQPKSRLLRRQKSTSEIETRHADLVAGSPLPLPHDQTPSSPVHNRRLLSARNMRMSSVELPDENEKSLSSASTSPCPSPKSHRLLPTNLYVVLYNFKSRHPDELDLKAGYKVTVIDASDKDWWKGKCFGRVGYFPSKYVIKLQPGEKALQVTHNLQVSDGNNGLMLLRDQIVIQVGEELDGMVMIRNGENQQGVCPLKFLQEV